MRKFLFVLLFLSLPQAMAGESRSCEQMLLGGTFDYREVRDRPVRFKPPVELKNKPPMVDIEIPEEVVDWAEAEAKIRNMPAEDLIFEKTMADCTYETAVEARARILAGIKQAGELVQSGQLDEAIEILNDPKILSGSGYSFPSNRDRNPIDPERVFGDDERTYTLQIRAMLTKRNYADPYNKIISIPHPPIQNGSRKQQNWAKRYWLRVAGEELGHLAQLMGQVINPDKGMISEMMASETGAVRFHVAREGERLNGERKLYGASWMFGPRYVLYSMEADVYAFLIETYGHEFVPWWYGQTSGYSPRELVDKELTRRGIPNRDWDNTFDFKNRTSTSF